MSEQRDSLYSDDESPMDTSRFIQPRSELQFRELSIPPSPNGDNGISIGSIGLSNNNRLSNGNNGLSNGSTNGSSVIKNALTPRRFQPRKIFSSATVPVGFRPILYIFILMAIPTLLIAGINCNITLLRGEMVEAINNHEKELLSLDNHLRHQSKESKDREIRLMNKMDELYRVMAMTKKFLHQHLVEGVPVPPLEFQVDTPEAKEDELVQFLENMRLESPRQNRDSFTQLLSTIQYTLRENDPRPASIILLVPPVARSSPFPICFARKLAAGINRIFTGPKYEVNPKELTLSELRNAPDVSDIIQSLKTYFRFEGGKAVIVHDLQQLKSYEMLMLFHTFSDNVVAYDNQATFIYTLSVPEEIYDKYNWVKENGARITSESLSSAWAGVLTADKIPGIISRIAVANILMQDGDNC